MFIAMVIYSRFALPWLTLIIAASLPGMILSQCTRLNPAACLSCSSCVGFGVGQGAGYWYTGSNGSGACNVSGYCTSSFNQIPCFDQFGSQNRYTSYPGDCSSCSLTPVIYSSRGYCSSTSGSCSYSNPQNCYTAAACYNANPGNTYWFNRDRSSSTAGKVGMCLTATGTDIWPCSSFSIQYSGTGSGTAAFGVSCSDQSSCSTCTMQYGNWITFDSSSSPSTGTCYVPGSYGICDQSYYFTPADSPCSSTGRCLQSSCGSGGTCSSSSTLCTSYQLYNCANCASCIATGSIWYSSSASLNIGTCVASSSSVPCGNTAFYSCSGGPSSTSYTSCSYSNNANYYAKNANSSVATGLIVGLVLFFVIWIANLVAIGLISRKKGLNPCPYIALAFFCGVFAWICVVMAQPNTTTVVVTEGIPLVPLQQKTAPNPYVNPAPNPYGSSQPPNPYGNPNYPAPNPYGQTPQPPNPSGDLAPNPY
jgi:hypothetical protein